MSTNIEYKGSTILTYHFISGYIREYSVHYLRRSVKGDTTVCNVKIYSNDTIADLKAAIEEFSGIPQQNQTLYKCDSGYKISHTWNNVNCISGHKHKLHDHQIVGDFVHYGRVYLDVRLLVIVQTHTSNSIPFEVLSCNDVLSLKHMIAIETDIPVEDQTLLANPMIVLENTNPVGAYVGKNRLTLDCMVLPVHFIRRGPPNYPALMAWEIRVPQHNAAKNKPWKPMNLLLVKSSVTLLIKVQFVLVLILVLCCSVVN